MVRRELAISAKVHIVPFNVQIGTFRWYFKRYRKRLR
jgi:hypothetical protein